MKYVEIFLPRTTYLSDLSRQEVFSEKKNI